LNFDLAFQKGGRGEKRLKGDFENESQIHRIDRSSGLSVNFCCPEYPTGRSQVAFLENLRLCCSYHSGKLLGWGLNGLVDEYAENRPEKKLFPGSIPMIGKTVSET
jgi:hypothetical protein